MAILGTSLADAQQRLAGREAVVSIAGSNGPRTTVISGEPEAVAAIVAAAAADDLFSRTVQVDVASHSPQMDPLVPELLAALADLPVVAPALPLYSTVFGRPLAADEGGARYWARNLRQPVLFTAAI
jgi:acyl transferase domain-containing protein